MGFKDRFADAIEKQQQGEEQALVYRLGDTLCLIPFKDIEDVVTPENVRKVPGASDFFKGFFIYEKKPIVLIDTIRKIGIKEHECPMAIIYNSEEKSSPALSISNILQAIPYNESYIHPISSENEYPLPIQYIEKVFNINQNIIFQLNLSSLI